jgi:hypothetical protein
MWCSTIFAWGLSASTIDSVAIPNPPPDPARPLVAFIPVYQVAVGSAALLAAAGVILAVVPALRRRRGLVITWVLCVSALSLAALVNLVRLLVGFT